ncbi:MAG: hypothetical protein KC588_15280, partial [Nitrospira sp.]|nr:hypothetical protein [Nitrospira sp.]
MSRCKNPSQQRAGKQPLRALECPATAIYDLIELLSDGERRNLNQQRETMKKTSNMPRRSLGMGTEAFPAYALCCRQGKSGFPAKNFFPSRIRVQNNRTPAHTARARYLP